MNNQNTREIWDGKAEQHADRRGCRAKDPDGILYEKSWWRHIEPLLGEISGGRILEAGCGTGRWVERLAPMGFEMVLSDISPKMLEKARESVEKLGCLDNVEFKVSDIGAMSWLEDDSFDMAIATGEPVTMCDTPQKAIKELCRVVKPGGYVLCDAGNKYRRAYDMFRDSPSGPVLQILETGKYTNHGGLVLHLLGPDEFGEIFSELGMDLMTLAGVTPFFTFPPNQGQKKAMQDPDIARDVEIIGDKFSKKTGMVYLASRLIAVARKPV